MHIVKSAIKKLLSGLFIAVACLEVSALDISYYTSCSALSDGNWVKIKVTETGMQQISHEQLREMGFSEPSKVTVFGFGGALLTDHNFSTSVPDDLPQQPVMYCADKIVFYGESDVVVTYDAKRQIAVRRNTAADGGYYFLTDGHPVREIPRKVTEESGETADTHMSIVLHEEELTNPFHAGAHFFGRDFAQEPRQEFQFHMPGRYEPGTEPVSFAMSGVLAGSTPTFAVTLPNGAKTTVKGTTTEGIDNAYFSNVSKSEVMVLDETNDDMYTVSVNTLSSRSLTYGAVDRITMAYRRGNRYGDSRQLRMLYPEIYTGNRVTVSDAGEGLRVWDVSSPVSVSELAGEYDSATRVLTVTAPADSYSAGNGCAAYIAFDPSRELNEVEYAGRVLNQNIHGQSVPDMIIIASAECRGQAERLAGIHERLQGFHVFVVGQDEIFNEFSSGTPSVMGLRRAVKMFYDREPGRLRHLLMFGGGSYDNRAIESQIKNHFDIFLLTYEVEDLRYMNHAATAYVSDAYFGMVADNYEHSRILYTPMQINVGRIPAVSESDAKSAVDKIEDYLMNPPVIAIGNRAMIMADGGNGNSHLDQAEALCDTIVKYCPSTTTLKCYNSLYPLDNLDARMLRSTARRLFNEGVGYYAYMGHGQANGFSAQNMWSRYETQSNDYAHAPFAMFATCDTYAYDRNENGIAKNMVYKYPGGAIAVVGASRTVYQDYNQYINTAVAREFFSADGETTTGDVYRNARDRVLSVTRDPDILVNTICYNMCGDPALPVYAPDSRIALTAGTHLTDDGLTVYPLADNTVNGMITDADGNIVSSFGGRVIATLMEPATVSNTLRQGSYTTDKVVSVTRHETVLSETSAKVEKGRFSISISCPENSYSGSGTMVSLYAVSDDGLSRAAGVLSPVTLSGFDADKSVPDNEPPVISEMYLDSPDFEEGDEVEGTAVFHAVVLPDATGLGTSQRSVASSVKLSLDGTKTFPYVSSGMSLRADGGAEIEFPVSNMADGHHQLTLWISDNAGNRASRSIDFNVINHTVDASLRVEEYPAVTEAVIQIEHTFSGEPVGRLVIEDESGVTVFTEEQVAFPYRWNLQNMAGDDVPDGRYRCYAILRNGLRFASTPKAEIIVVK